MKKLVCAAALVAFALANGAAVAQSPVSVPSAATAAPAMADRPAKKKAKKAKATKGNTKKKAAPAAARK